MPKPTPQVLSAVVGGRMVKTPITVPYWKLPDGTVTGDNDIITEVVIKLGEAVYRLTQEIDDRFSAALNVPKQVAVLAKTIMGEEVLDPKVYGQKD